MNALLIGPYSSRQVGAIPHTLSHHACIDFVNSRFSDHTGTGDVYDRFESADWWPWFADRCGVHLDKSPTAAVRHRLVDLRDLLRPLLMSRRTPDKSTLATLNRILAERRQSWELVRDQGRVVLRRVWRQEDWGAVMATTVASYGELLGGADIDLVKLCGNPDCTFIFVDETRNQSRRWCHGAACGNLVKVRRHRARQRHAASDVDETALGWGARRPRRAPRER